MKLTRLTKKIELLMVNYLLKRGYQVSFPLIYFSSPVVDHKWIYSASYWRGKKEWE